MTGKHCTASKSVALTTSPLSPRLLSACTHTKCKYMYTQGSSMLKVFSLRVGMRKVR
jgi:hypothetical protein